MTVAWCFFSKSCYAHLLKSESLEGIPGSPGKSQKEGKEVQGKVKDLEANPLAVLGLTGPSALPTGSSLGSLSFKRPLKGL